MINATTGSSSAATTEGHPLLEAAAGCSSASQIDRTVSVKFAAMVGVAARCSFEFGEVSTDPDGETTFVAMDGDFQAAGVSSFADAVFGRANGAAGKEVFCIAVREAQGWATYYLGGPTAELPAAFRERINPWVQVEIA